MPTITCKFNDLNQLAGTNLTVSQLEKAILLVKGELKDYDSATDDLKIELQDTNRPDLWTVEGIARQLKFKLTDRPPHYSWLSEETLPLIGTMTVDPDLDYRPYAGAIAVSGINVTDDLLIGMIQTQEKLADNLGRHRKSLSIGIYDLEQIKFPVHYQAVDRNSIQFVPLDSDKKMSPEEILSDHPKGQAYAHILEGHKKVPILVDSEGTVMSFPPIINSRTSGEVKTGKRDLFGGEIGAIRVKYEIDTPFGTDVIMPLPFQQRNKISRDMVKRWLGVDYQIHEMTELLEKYGYLVDDTDLRTGEIEVIMPPWRHDLLHPVDIIEDLAISDGYDNIKPLMPSSFTVGKIAPNIVFEDRIRNIILPFGYEEVISNILCSCDEFKDMVREPDRQMVEISNPLNIKFAAVRDRLLPSLLRVERDSSQATYPHRIFETGEVTVHDSETETGCKTKLRLCVLIADKEAEFPNVHSCLESLLFSLGLSSKLKSNDIPVFIPGRSGEIFVQGQALGWIGEIHPEVLENFEISMPCAAFEIDIDLLQEIYKTN